jgi:selenide,water dikinase
MERLPLLDAGAIMNYISNGCIPGGTHRNFASYGDRIASMTDDQKYLICDPQTSGGLLLAVDPGAASEIEQVLADHGLYHIPIGRFGARDTGAVVSFS